MGGGWFFLVIGAPGVALRAPLLACPARCRVGVGLISLGNRGAGFVATNV